MSLRPGLQRTIAALKDTPRLFQGGGGGSSSTIEDLRALTAQTATAAEYPLATSIVSNIPHYDLPSFSPSSSSSQQGKGPPVSALQDEWYRVLGSGPGCLVLQGAWDPEGPVLRRATEALDAIIAREEAEAASPSSSKKKKKGDHFAASGANSRVWNSLQKHAAADPWSFVRYYANPWLAAVSEAWLGPMYRVTAQANVVRPGGQAQSPHRDYHLGFQTEAGCARFPASAHAASQHLTLQGGVAHSDMPAASGPTRLLPFSQLLPEGYLAWRSPGAAALFAERWAAAPMRRGDAVFFNPALMHAAGANSTAAVHRAANLLQVSSAMGRPMESTDAVPMVESCWDELVAFAASEGGGGGGGGGAAAAAPAAGKGEGEGEEEERDGRWRSAAAEACIDAIGDGYPFPSNLDNRAPGPDGMTPASETDIMRQGLRERWSAARVVAELRQMRADSAA